MMSQTAREGDDAEVESAESKTPSSSPARASAAAGDLDRMMEEEKVEEPGRPPSPPPPPQQHHREQLQRLALERTIESSELRRGLISQLTNANMHDYVHQIRFLGAIDQYMNNAQALALVRGDQAENEDQQCLAFKIQTIFILPGGMCPVQLDRSVHTLVKSGNVTAALERARNQVLTRLCTDPAILSLLPRD